MKTKSNKFQKQNENSGLANRPEQLSTRRRSKSNLPYINFSERETNRQLPADYIMVSLARWMPYQHKLAKVAGGLISIQFEQAPIQRIRQELSEYGFTWNEKRNSWQHIGGRANV
jgi:hypothetical protein